MKSLKKFLSVMLVLAVFTAALVIPAAAATTDATANPGKTATLEFTVDDIYGIDGTYSFDNEEIIESVSVAYMTEMNGQSSEANKAFIYSIGNGPLSFTMKFEVKLKADVKAGDTFTVTIKYETANKEGDVTEWITETATLKVVVENKPVDPPNPPQPPVVTIDYTELLHQISIAEGLDEAKYTDASWENLMAALNAARDLTTSKSQDAVDAGAQALKDAIAALKLMDYSELLEAIELVEKLFGEDELGSKWAELYTKMMAAKDLLTSGDQAAVDAAAEELNKLYQEMLDLIEQYLEDNKEIVEVEKEVIVEVEPEGPFCNISIHSLWPILFAISAVLNVALIAVIVIYVVRRKQNQKDETPLVDYDIDDDKE